MIRQYSISDILALPSQHISCYAGAFEGTEDPDIEWPHRHSFFSLVWFTGGAGLYVIDFEEYEIKPDRIFFVSPKQIHNWDYSQESKGYILMVDYAPAIELKLSYPFPLIDIEGSAKDLLNAVFPALIDSSRKGRDIKTDILYIHQLIERFAAGSSTKNFTANPYLGRFKELIAEEFSGMLTVEDYAARLQLPTDELNILCKQYTGESAKQFVLDIKMTEAKRLLLYSTCNVNEVAFRLGFEDSSYFSRIFRKKTSYSPSDFLKKYRKQG